MIRYFYIVKRNKINYMVVGNTFQLGDELVASFYCNGRRFNMTNQLKQAVGNDVEEAILLNKNTLAYLADPYTMPITFNPCKDTHGFAIVQQTDYSDDEWFNITRVLIPSEPSALVPTAY